MYPPAHPAAFPTAVFVGPCFPACITRVAVCVECSIIPVGSLIDCYNLLQLLVVVCALIIACSLEKSKVSAWVVPAPHWLIPARPISQHPYSFPHSGYKRHSRELLRDFILGDTGINIERHGNIHIGDCQQGTNGSERRRRNSKI